MCIFLMVLWVGLQGVIVAFRIHAHLLAWKIVLLYEIILTSRSHTGVRVIQLTFGLLSTTRASTNAIHAKACLNIVWAYKIGRKTDDHISTNG